jgi:hypothetical protein
MRFSQLNSFDLDIQKVHGLKLWREEMTCWDFVFEGREGERGDWRNRPAIRLFGHERVLETRGKTGTSAAAQARCLDLIDGPFPALQIAKEDINRCVCGEREKSEKREQHLLHNLVCHVPVSVLLRTLEGCVMLSVDVLEDPVLVRQRGKGPASSSLCHTGMKDFVSTLFGKLHLFQRDWTCMKSIFHVEPQKACSQASWKISA